MGNQVQPRILTGFMELLPEDQLIMNRLIDTIRGVYEEFGFLPLDTPVIELSEVLLAKAGGETEKQIYRFQKGDHDLSLRFDLTVPLARYTAQHAADLVFPFKRYQISKVFRGERPQKGRFREFYQCDIDVIGQDELPLFYDAEMPAVIAQIFDKLELGNFVIRINNRKLLSGYFRSLGLGEQSTAVLRIIDKLEKIGKDKVVLELGDLEINEETAEGILAFLQSDAKTDEVLKRLKDSGIEDEQFKEGVSELEQVAQGMRQLGVPENRYKLDLTIARGLDYYTGTVYETFLSDYPELGSVCSGGRYDNLTGFYTNQKMPGIGISIGLTRLFSQLKEKGGFTATRKSLVEVLVVPMGAEQMDAALTAAKELRAAGIKTDVYALNKGMKQKLKYASRLGIPYVALIGEDEAATGEVTLKNMDLGQQEKLSIQQMVEKVQTVK